MLARSSGVEVPAKIVLLASLGASICDRLVESPESRQVASDAAARLDTRLATGDRSAWHTCDLLSLAVAYALAPPETRTEPARAAVRAICGVDPRDDEPASPRRVAIARSLGAAASEYGEGAQAGDALCAQILHGSADTVSALCDQIDAFGLHARSAESLRLVGAAIAARAFSSFRASSKFELGTRLLRVLAGCGLDEIGTAEGMQVLRMQQRVEGSYGDLPPVSAQAGDISFAFHLPRTVASLWAIHDALAPISLVRLAMAAPGR
jgi:hypothetical protein